MVPGEEAPQILTGDEEIYKSVLDNEGVYASLEPAHGIHYFRDYYQVLGVSRDANIRDIDLAFRKLSVIVHPDKSRYLSIPITQKYAYLRFRVINTARRILANPETRAKYNDELANWKGLIVGDESINIENDIPVNAGRGILFNWIVVKDWYQTQVKRVSLNEQQDQSVHLAMQLGNSILSGSMPPQAEAISLIRNTLRVFDNHLTLKEQLLREAIGMSLAPIANPSVNYVKGVRAEFERRMRHILADHLFAAIHAETTPGFLLPEKIHRTSRLDLSFRDEYFTSMSELLNQLAEELLQISLQRQELIITRLNFAEGIELNRGKISSNTVILFSSVEDSPRIFALRRAGKRILAHKTLQEALDLFDLDNDLQGSLGLLASFCDMQNHWFIQVDHEPGLPVDDQIKVVLTKHYNKLDNQLKEKARVRKKK